MGTGGTAVNEGFGPSGERDADQATREGLGTAGSLSAGHATLFANILLGRKVRLRLPWKPPHCHVPPGRKELGTI